MVSDCALKAKAWLRHGVNAGVRSTLRGLKAEECYQTLKAGYMFAENGAGEASVDSYVSVPSKGLKPGCVSADGALAKAFKYGREPGRDEVTKMGNRLVLLIPVHWRNEVEE